MLWHNWLRVGFPKITVEQMIYSAFNGALAVPASIVFIPTLFNKRRHDPPYDLLNVINVTAFRGEVLPRKALLGLMRTPRPEITLSTI